MMKVYAKPAVILEVVQGSPYKGNKPVQGPEK